MIVLHNRAETNFSRFLNYYAFNIAVQEETQLMATNLNILLRFNSAFYNVGTLFEVFLKLLRYLKA